MRLREFTNDTVANWKTIAARNNLANPDFILPGQTLDVGDGIVLPKGTTYVVKPGDTLSGIAKNIRQGWRPDADSSATIEPTNPDSTTMGNAIAAAGGQSGASDPDSTTMGNAIASAGGTKSQSPQTKKSQPNPSKYPGGVAKRSAPKQSAPPEVPKPPVINLPNVDPPEVKRGRPTMKDDPRLKPNTEKPSKSGYHDPVYDAPSATKSAQASRTGPLATDQDWKASIENLKNYDADQKQRMADREKNYKKELAAAEKAKKETEKWQKKYTDPRVDPKGIQKKNAPTNKNVETTNDRLKTIQKNVHGQESGSGSADTSKPNYAGAIGPMQILPKTFDWLKQLGKIPKDYDINNPEHNKAGGDALLGHYHDKYKGDPAKVYAAYYGGPSAVNKDGSINTHWRDKKNPKAPTVGEYIRQTMSRSGK